MMNNISEKIQTLLDLSKILQHEFCYENILLCQFDYSNRKS